jgi:hypothetical protein
METERVYERYKEAFFVFATIITTLDGVVLQVLRNDLIMPPELGARVVSSREVPGAVRSPVTILPRQESPHYRPETRTKQDRPESRAGPGKLGAYGSVGGIG